ncbi:sulfotransferase family protein [Salinibacter pepae]|uniref:sulfotransferase family protein n=1 Tax=Salinibacter pepae TaxID=3040382 RepID=UPI0021E865D8|nr:sulfotransferase [Salinibacter pepae]
MRPDFIIVGAMKSGTSTLAHYLRQHPEIYMPDDEVHFFYEEGRGHWQKGVTWYEAQFQEASVKQIVGEKTPTYSYLPAIPKRIHDLLPDIKLIWVFRNPVDRTYSNYWHAVCQGTERSGFAEAVRREDERDKWKGYVRRSQYSDQVDRYLDYFDRDQMYFSLFEDLKGDPEALLEEVFHFLEVDPKYSQQSNNRVRENVTKIPRFATARYITRSISDEIPLLGALIYYLDQCVNRRGESGYPEMDEGIRDHLRVYFQKYNDKLEDLTGLDTSKWN